jgi:hypothetical protein
MAILPRAAALDRRSTAATAALVIVATAGVVLQQEMRTPLQLPGHRGLVWLGLLVAVRLIERRPGPAMAVGVASAGLTAAFGLSPAGPLGALPYLLAAAALDATALVPWLRERAWPVVVLAAPVHLVALLVPLSSSLVAGVAPIALAQGLAAPALLHVCFGAGAGLLGCALAAAWRRADAAIRDRS